MPLIFGALALVVGVILWRQVSAGPRSFLNLPARWTDGGDVGFGYRAIFDPKGRRFLWHVESGDVLSETDIDGLTGSVIRRLKSFFSGRSMTLEQFIAEGWIQVGLLGPMQIAMNDEGKTAIFDASTRTLYDTPSIGGDVGQASAPASPDAPGFSSLTATEQFSGIAFAAQVTMDTFSLGLTGALRAAVALANAALGQAVKALGAQAPPQSTPPTAFAPQATPAQQPLATRIAMQLLSFVPVIGRLAAQFNPATQLTSEQLAAQTAFAQAMAVNASLAPAGPFNFNPVAETQTAIRLGLISGPRIGGPDEAPASPASDPGETSAVGQAVSEGIGGGFTTASTASGISGGIEGGVPSGDPGVASSVGQAVSEGVGGGFTTADPSSGISGGIEGGSVSPGGGGSAGDSGTGTGTGDGTGGGPGPSDGQAP